MSSQGLPCLPASSQAASTPPSVLALSDLLVTLAQACAALGLQGAARQLAELACDVFDEAEAQDIARVVRARDRRRAQERSAIQRSSSNTSGTRWTASGRPLTRSPTRGAPATTGCTVA